MTPTAVAASGSSPHINTITSHTHHSCTCVPNTRVLYAVESGCGAGTGLNSQVKLIHCCQSSASSSAVPLVTAKAHKRHNCNCAHHRNCMRMTSPHDAPHQTDHGSSRHTQAEVLPPAPERRHAVAPPRALRLACQQHFVPVGLVQRQQQGVGASAARHRDGGTSCAKVQPACTTAAGIHTAAATGESPCPVRWLGPLLPFDTRNMSTHATAQASV